MAMASLSISILLYTRKEPVGLAIHNHSRTQVICLTEEMCLHESSFWKNMVSVATLSEGVRCRFLIRWRYSHRPDRRRGFWLHWAMKQITIFVIVKENMVNFKFIFSHSSVSVLTMTKISTVSCHVYLEDVHFATLL